MITLLVENVQYVQAANYTQVNFNYLYCSLNHTLSYLKKFKIFKDIQNIIFIIEISIVYKLKEDI